MKVFLPKRNVQNKGPVVWKVSLAYSLAEKVEVETESIRNLLSFSKEVMTSDIIHTYDESPASFFSALIAFITKKKHVHTIHGDFYRELKSKRGVKRLLWIPFNIIPIVLSNKIVFPSQYLKNALSSNLRRFRNKFQVIHNGIDVDFVQETKGISKNSLGLSSDDYLLMEITSFRLYEKAKGCVELVRAFRNFRSKNPQSYLYIIGDGKYLETFKRKYETKHIRFLGYKSNALEYLKASDVFIHSSHIENFPLVILEAMALKKPVISLDVGGIKEIIGKNEGILVPTHVEDLATAIDKVYNDKVYCIQLAEASFQKVQHFDIKVMRDKYLQLYKNLLEQ